MASDTTAEVKITGDASGAVEASATASEAVEDSTDGIIAAFTRMAAESGASMAEFSASVREGAASASESLESMEKSIEHVNGVFQALAGVAIGGIIGEEFLELGRYSAEFAESIQLASQKTGVAADTLQQLKFAASTANVGFDQLQSALDRLNKATSEAVGGNQQMASTFAALGISLDQLKESSPDEVLKLIADRFADASDGANKTAFAMALLGRGGAALIPILDQGSAGLEELGEKASAAGVVMDAETREKAEKLAETLKQADASAQGLKLTASGELGPTMQALSDWFISSSQQGGSLRTVVDLLVVGVDALAFVFADAATSLNIFKELLDGTTLAVEMLAEGEWKQAGAAIDATNTKIVTMADDMNRLLDTMTGVNAEMKNFGAAGDWEEDKDWGIQGGWGKDLPALPKPPKQEQDPSQMASYENELDQRKVIYEKENELREMSLEKIREYWQEVSNYADISGKDSIAVARKIADATLEINRQALKQQEELSNEQIDSTEKVALAQVSAQEAHAKALYNDKKISADQLLAVDLQYEQERLNIQMQALAQRFALLQEDPTNNAVALQKVKDQMLMVEQQYLAKVQALHDNAAKQEDKTWQNASKSMVSTFGSAFEGILTGTESFAQAAESILKGLLNIFVGIGEQMVEKWVTDNLLNDTSTKVTALSSINANAAVAGSAAFAALSAIPIVGPELAPAGAAAAYSGALSYAGMVGFSAEGGFDIPAGINPLVQAHQREMILPADLAENVRNMTSGSGGNMQVHFNVTAIDANGVKKFFQRNNGSIVAALQRAVNTGGISGATS